jgi:hypothetical protein
MKKETLVQQLRFVYASIALSKMAAYCSLEYLLRELCHGLRSQRQLLLLLVVLVVHVLLHRHLHHDCLAITTRARESAADDARELARPHFTT